jgi:cobalt-zinc-cadmium efflux system membrane fusion protein
MKYSFIISRLNPTFRKPHEYEKEFSGQAGFTAKTLLIALVWLLVLAGAGFWILKMEPQKSAAHEHHHGGHDDHEEHDDHAGHTDHSDHSDHDSHEDNSDHSDHDEHSGHEDHAKHNDPKDHAAIEKRDKQVDPTEQDEHDHHDDHANHSDPQNPLSSDVTYPDRWQRVKISEQVLRAAGVVWKSLEPQSMAVRIPLAGRIVLNADRVAHVHPRFPGIIRSVSKALGEKVSRGEELVVVESNESLQRYAVTSQIAGTVISKHATLGESASDGKELFVIADLSTVWADFQVYRQDFPKLRVGQSVRVVSESDTINANIAYLAPVGDEHSQTLVARAVLDNRDGRWAPGLFVSGEVAVDTFTVPALPLEAVQRWEGQFIVYVRDLARGREAWVAHPIELGRRDGAFVELRSGPPPGAEIVIRNSYLLKAEAGKGEAGHEH